MPIKLLFIAEIIIMIIVSAMLIKNVVIKIPDNDRPQPKKVEKKFSDSKKDIFINICIIFANIVGIADIVGLMGKNIFHGGFFVIGIILLLEKIIHIIRTRIQSRTLKFLGKMLVIAGIIELVIFQMPSYRMFFGKYTHMLLPVSKGTITSENTEFEESTGNLKVSGQNKSSIEFSEINAKIATAYVNIASSNKNPHRLKLEVDITDDTSELYRNALVKSEIVTDHESTKYINFLLSGKTDKLQFNFFGETDNDFFTIESIELNVPIPFDISFLRIFLIVLISTFAYAVIFSAFLSRDYAENKWFCNISTAVITVTAVGIALGMTISKIPADSEKYFLQKSGNQISEELVLAFENKQVSLLDEPSKELLEIENPYDTNLRGSSNVYSKWDHVLYNGKYYSYYGIAPVILLFLPYHLITGSFFPTDIAVMLFAIIGIVFLALTYNAIIKRWFSRIPSGCYIAGMTIIMIVCGIWFSVGRPLFYEISISSGFAFVALGAYFLISSNIISDGKISFPRITLASLFLAIAVLCRPTLAVYSICACVYYAIGFKKSAEVTDSEGVKTINKKRYIPYILCALIPFVILGSVQMWYNYVRFDSPLDFGIKYSLTINDFTHSEYHTIFALIGIFAYLFQFPTIKADYPYVETWFTYFRANGYYFKDNGQTSGIIWLALPVFGYLLAGKALKKLPDKSSKLKATTIIGLPCIIMPLVILFSIWESGYAVRYVADFSWQIIMGAYAILFFLYQKSQNDTLKKLFKYFMAFSVVASIIVNVPQIFNFTFSEYDFPVITSKFHEFIEFWI